jgi:hypothetical protein
LSKSGVEVLAEISNHSNQTRSYERRRDLNWVGE